jgi:uncharacterized membrane-anchored protein YhcB (DUF1043 family)
MTIDFHFTDTPPQVYLDELHSIDVPKLYDPLLSKQQRGNLMVLIRKRLGDWQKKVQTQLQSINGRYDSNNRDKATLLMAPYQTLSNLGKDLDKAITELEKGMRAGRVVPPGFSFGKQIFGDLERGEWHLGESEDAKRWGNYLSLRRRMETIGAEYKPLVQHVKIAQARVKQQENDLRQMTKEYNRRRSPLDIILRVLPVLIVTIIALVAGWYAFRAPEPLNDAMSNQAVGGILLVVGTVGAILMVVLERRRTRHLRELQENLTGSKRFLKDLKVAFKQARLDYYPTDKLYKELQTEYKRLKATFP